MLCRCGHAEESHEEGVCRACEPLIEVKDWDHAFEPAVPAAPPASLVPVPSEPVPSEPVAGMSVSDEEPTADDLEWARRIVAERSGLPAEPESDSAAPLSRLRPDAPTEEEWRNLWAQDGRAMRMVITERDEARAALAALRTAAGAEIEALREALQWCVDEGGWRLPYYAGERLPVALSQPSTTSAAVVKSSEELRVALGVLLSVDTPETKEG